MRGKSQIIFFSIVVNKKARFNPQARSNSQLHSSISHNAFF